MFAGGNKPFDNVGVMDFIDYLDDDNKLEFTEETPKQM